MSDIVRLSDLCEFVTGCLPVMVLFSLQHWRGCLAVPEKWTPEMHSVGLQLSTVADRFDVRAASCQGSTDSKSKPLDIGKKTGLYCLALLE